jgi:hypothetical protein
MKHRYPRDVLTADEAERARRFAQKHGLDDAARRIGIAPRTFAKAAAGLPVQRLTAFVVRSRLPNSI